MSNVVPIKWPKRLFLCGANIWAYWLPVKPGLRLYSLVDYDTKTCLYTFKPKGHTMPPLMLTYADLLRFGGGGVFKPFLINPALSPELQEHANSFI
jgi:hypothetical protein